LRLLVEGPRNSTKHLHDYIKIYPSKKFKDIRDMKQKKTKKKLVRDRNKVDSTTGVNAYHFDQNVSGNELAHMIILHEYPFL